MTLGQRVRVEKDIRELELVCLVDALVRCLSLCFIDEAVLPYDNVQMWLKVWVSETDFIKINCRLTG